ncbi:MAG: transporter [Ginsengibacter sp.]
MNRSFFFILIFLFIAIIASAQPDAIDEIDTDRPDQTESPVTILRKWMQVEHGFALEKDNQLSVYGSSTLLRYGLVKNVELRLEADFIYTPSNKFFPGHTELLPIILGTKISLWEERKWIPKTSLLVHAGLPFLAAKSFKNFDVQPGVRFTFQNNLSQVVSWGYNAGIEWDGENSNPYYLYTFSNGINLSKSLYGFLELFGSLNKDELPRHNFDAGLSLSVSDDCKVDISSAIGLTKTAPDWSIAIGMSVRFKTYSTGKVKKSSNLNNSANKLYGNMTAGN